MLEHLGRRSGHRRYVVLEVIDCPSPGRYVVSSGFGERSQWFRNVMTNHRVVVYVGGHRPPATGHRPTPAQRLDPGAASASLARYAAMHPRTWSGLRPVLEQTLGARIDESATELPLMAFDTTIATSSER
jgi:deazaflavin-dependent oxidoreductase (nitroreductase family)